jgi:predicted GH43/DUF377 family glycosyl hydrolase
VDLTDYAVKITLTTANFDFSLAQANGADLRFTDSDSLTPLAYWVQSYDAAARKAVVWVKVPHIPAGSTCSIFLYSGNSSAPDAQSGAATFPLFSDFDQTFNVVAPALPGAFDRMIRSPECAAPLVAPGTFGEYDHFGFREHGNVLVDSTEPDPSRRYKMWFSAYRDSIYTTDRVTQLGAAFSADGYTWVKQGRVNPWTYGEDPWVVKVGGTYFLYYEDKTNPTWDRVGLMTSTDALNWTYQGFAVPPDPTRPWMDTSPSSPTVWVEYGATDTTWYVYFEGKGSCQNCGGGSIGLATSHDGYHFTVYGQDRIIPLGSTGQWDDGAMVPDNIIKINGQYWLIYHGLSNSNPNWKAGFAVSNDLIHWTKVTNGSNNLNASDTGDPQLFWDRNGALQGTECIDYYPVNRSGIFRTYLCRRDTAQWPYNSVFTLVQKGSNYGLANDSASVLTLSGEAFLRSSASIVSTQRFTDGFSIEMKSKCQNYGTGSPPYCSVAIGSGEVVDMNVGGVAQWETTVLQSGYAWFTSGSGVMVRMPASGGKTVLSSWSPSPGLMQNYNIHRFIYDDTDSLKWYAGDTLRAAFRDATFRTANKRVLVSQGEYVSGAGGEMSLDWMFVRKYIHHEPSTLVGNSENHAFVHLTTPNGGEIWQAGLPATVTWTSRGITGLLRLELNRNFPSGTWEMAADSLADTGTYSLTDNGIASDHCRIRLSAVSDMLSDMSDADFHILPRLMITSPSGGERWLIGEVHTVQWQSFGIGGAIRVELDRHAATSSWAILGDSLPNTGNLSITVAGPVSDSCRIRITDDATGFTAVSNSVFSISGATIQVVSPNGGEEWKVGVPGTVRWTSQFVSGAVRVQLNRDYPDGPWESLADSIDNSGQYDAEIIEPVSDHCRVRVQELGDTLNDLSDADFRIIPNLLLVAPNGGERWRIHETSTVQWIGAGWPGLVRLEMNRNYPQGAWSLLVDSLPNTGITYIDAGDSLSETCRIRISTLGTNFEDVSDSDFSILASDGLLVLVRPNQPGLPVTNWDIGTVECPMVASDTFMLRNLGSQDVNVYYSPEPASGMFSERSSCGDYITLPPGQMSACDMVLTFGLPDHDGLFEDTLLIPTDAANQNGGFVRIPLSGHRVTTPPAPQVTISMEGDDARLTWPSVTQTAGGCALSSVQYNVYGALTADGPYDLLTTTPDTTYLDPGAVQSTQHRLYAVTTVTNNTVLQLAGMPHGNSGGQKNGGRKVSLH